MSERVKGWLMTAALACVPLAICINVGRVVLSAGSPRVAVPETVAAAPDDYAAVKATTADPEVRWLVLDPGLSLLPPELFRDTFTVMARGKAAGRYRIAAFTARGSKVSEPAVCTVVVGQPGPVPPVPPGPGPVPPVPDTLGLVAVSRAGKAAVTLPAAERDGQAAALAKAQRAVIDRIKAGTLADPADILEAWRAANNGAVKAADWAGWAGPVSAKLSALYAAKQLAAPAAWQAAFAEIAAGLEG